MHQPRLTAIVVVAATLFIAACGAPRARSGESLASDAVQKELGCTPLLLTVSSRGGVGCGSGVLIHPRLILTAGHVVPQSPTSVTAFIAGEERGEAVRISRVWRKVPDPADGNTSNSVDPGGTGAWAKPGAEGDDWAILVLDHPFVTLRAVPARRLAAPTSPMPARGQQIVIAGYPLADSTTPDPYDRTALLLRTVVVPRPPGFPHHPAIFYGRDNDGDADRTGASGGPVFAASADGPSVLIGMYLGEANRHFLGIRFARELALQRLPFEAIQTAQRALDGE